MNEQVAAHASTQRQLFIFLPSTIPPRSHCCCCCCCYFSYSLMLMILSFSLSLLQLILLLLLFQNKNKNPTHTRTHWRCRKEQNNVHWHIQTVAHCFSQPPFPVFRLKLWAMSRRCCTRTMCMRRALEPAAMVVVSFFIVSVHWSLIFLTTAAYLFTCHSHNGALLWLARAFIYLFLPDPSSSPNVHSRLLLLPSPPPLLLWLRIFLTTC